MIGLIYGDNLHKNKLSKVLPLINLLIYQKQNPNVWHQGFVNKTDNIFITN